MDKDKSGWCKYLEDCKAKPTLSEIKIKAVKAAIRRHRGYKPAAAKELGVSLKTIYNILERERTPQPTSGTAARSK